MTREEFNISKKPENVNSKLANFIVNYSFIATFISIYILNNNSNIPSYTYTRIINLVMTMVLLSLLVLYAIKEMKLSLKTYSLLFSAISISFVVLLIRWYIIFHWIYLVTIVLLLKEKDIRVNLKVKKTVIWASSIFVLYQLSTTRFLGTVPVLSWQDPNYSAYYIFMLGVFSKKSGYKKISLILLLLGFLTLSRTYILAVLLFLVFENINSLKILFIKCKMVGFFRLMIISLIVVLAFGSFYIAKERDVTHFTDRGVERLFVVGDLSNLHRFIANEKFIDSILSNPGQYLFGMDTPDYQNKVFMNTPHNAFLALIVNYGILFFFPFILLYGMSFNKLFSKDNIPLIIPQFIFYSFLGAGIQGFPGLLLFFTLRECSSNKLMYKSKLH